MSEARRHPDLAKEALRADLRRDFRLQHLHGDSTLVTEVPGEKNHCHSTLAQWTLDYVAAFQARGEAIMQTEHAGYWRLALARAIGLPAGRFLAGQFRLNAFQSFAARAQLLERQVHERTVDRGK